MACIRKKIGSNVITENRFHLKTKTYRLRSITCCMRYRPISSIQGENNGNNNSCEENKRRYDVRAGKALLKMNWLQMMELSKASEEGNQSHTWFSRKEATVPA